ncbi:DUF6542 domain-containing protein [Streptomyces poriticola]|uniref:DUF6542 domain-containing protein n=1 Tax=Streptomyces poriticola TaxID=3120506 RepID=UPI002FCE34FD
MEQHRTRPPHHGTRRGRPPLPPQGRGAEGGPAGRAGPAARGGSGGRGGGSGRAGAGRGGGPPRRRPAARALAALRRMPNPRLTGLGCGLFCAAVMPAVGFLDRLLFGASLTVYSVLFLPVCVLTAVWVRRGDLLTAPVVVPIAFALGLLTVAEKGDGGSGRLMGLVTALATEAGWLYGGTLIAGSVVIVRRIRMVRALRRRAATARTPARSRAMSRPPGHPPKHP